VEAPVGVHIVLGELSGAMEDCIRFYWDILSPGTPALGAQLHFRRIPYLLVCRDCDTRFPPAGTEHVCPRCGGREIRLLTGDDFYLESLEVEPGVAESLERSPQP
jgi:hydrogenase nickel incorporation protein HypA/HybF